MKREKQGSNNHTGAIIIIASPKFDEDRDYTIEVKNAMNSFF